MISEHILQKWSLPPSETNEKCKQTYSLIKTRIEQSLIDDQFDIFLQWSYANATNIKEDSDVDIIICRKSSYRPNYWLMNKTSNYLLKGNIDISYRSFYDFKTKVKNALVGEFWNSIIRKDKCLRLKIQNPNLVNADIVPTYELHKFINNTQYYPWIAFFSDEWRYIENFPKLHQKHWDEKNQNTNGIYKSMVRLIKNCKAYYIDNYWDESKMVSSFMIESCLRNLPNYIYLQHYWTTSNLCNWVIIELLRQLQHPSSFKEISGLSILFDWSSNKYSAQQVQNFLVLIHKLINGYL